MDNHAKEVKTNQGQATASGFRLTSYILLALAAFVLAVFLLRHFWLRVTPYQQAVSLIKAGKAASALPILEQLSLQHPENANLFPWLAQGYLSCERIAEGRIALDTALRMGLPASDVIDAVKAYGNFYEQRGDYEEAEKLFQSASSTCPPPIINESRAKLYFDWAEDNLDEDNVEQAIVHFEQAGKLSNFIQEPLRSTIPRRLAEGYKRLAASSEASGDYKQAAEMLEKSLIANDQPSTRMALAQIYTQLNRIDKAIENYQVIADADQDNLEARHHLVDLLIQSNNLTGAQEALVELIDKEKSIENYQQLVDVDLRMKNYAGAVHALEDACELGEKPELYTQLLNVLNDWQAVLTKEHKLEEAASVKGHAERVAEQLNQLLLDKSDENGLDDKMDNKFAAAKNLPVALVSSRVWLSSGSFTPEGEIKIKNITGRPVRDLTLTAIFYDHTLKHKNGTVSLPVATPASAPFAASGLRTLYFSCPETVKADHQLAVKLFWQRNFLKEFPVAKLP